MFNIPGELVDKQVNGSIFGDQPTGVVIKQTQGKFERHCKEKDNEYIISSDSD